MFGGQYGQKMYYDISVDQYIKENLVNGKKEGRVKAVSKHTSNLEFEIKLKDIPDKLYTKKGREIGKQRVDFMKKFFDRLEKEINGEL